jgi:hypothetical protein
LSREDAGERLKRMGMLIVEMEGKSGKGWVKVKKRLKDDENMVIPEYLKIDLLSTRTLGKVPVKSRLGGDGNRLSNI